MTTAVPARSRSPSPSAKIAARFGRLTARSALVYAALIAAHGAAGRDESFRASDVRFFYLLFGNWIELDVLQPGQDLDLTQVRRALARLAHDGGAVAANSSRGSARARGARWSLTDRGLVALVEALVDPRPRRPFDESLFVISFAALYRDAILGRLSRTGRATSTRIRELLEPRRILRAARSTLDELATDLARRAHDGRALANESARAHADGADRREAAQRLERVSPYQLHRMRPLAELLDSLPEDLAKIELGAGIAWRTHAMFEPMADVVRAQKAALDAVEKRIEAADHSRR